MAIVDEKSTQLTNGDAVPVVRTHAVDVTGKLRVGYFDYTRAVAGDIGSKVTLFKLPPGRVRVYPGLSRLTISALGASRTVDLGFAAYTGLDGVAVTADPDYFWSAVDCSGAVADDWVEAATVEAATGKLFQSRDGVELNMTVSGGAMDVGETVQGFVIYTMDA